MNNHADALARIDLNVRQVTDRIMRVYLKASESEKGLGAEWYTDARSFARELAYYGHLSVPQVSAVIAHLSPRVHWSRNKREARSLVMTGHAKGLGAVIARANRAMASDDPMGTFGPTAPKTRSFALNISGDDTAVTIDMWACLVAGITDQQLGRAGVYDAVAHCFRLAAKRAGISPSAMQATTWIVQRGSAT